MMIVNTNRAGRMLAGAAMMAALGLSTSSPAHAITVTWTGDIDNEWTTVNAGDNPETNWSPDQLPGSGDTASFDVAATITVDSAQAVAGLAFGSNATVLSGSQLTLSNITRNSGTNNFVTINNDILLSDDAVFTRTTNSNGNAQMALNGIISDGGNNYSVEILGTERNQDRVLALAGNNTFGGGVLFNGGQLGIGHSNALGTGTFFWNHGSNGQAQNGQVQLRLNNLDIANDIVLGTGFTFRRIIASTGSAYTLSGDISGGVASNRLDISLGNNTRVLTLSGNNTFASELRLNQGIVNIDGTQSHANFSDIANANTRILAGSGLINWNFDGDDHDFMGLANSALNITDLNLNFIFNGLQTLDEYVIGAYQSLTGTEFNSVSGLGSLWTLEVAGTNDNPGNLLVLVRQQPEQEPDAPAVPEPATLAMLGVSGLLLLRRRSR
jgi:hypothetical protein